MPHTWHGSDGRMVFSAPTAVAKRHGGRIAGCDIAKNATGRLRSLPGLCLKPLRLWFHVMWLMMPQKTGLSAKNLCDTYEFGG